MSNRGVKERVLACIEPLSGPERVARASSSARRNRGENSLKRGKSSDILGAWIEKKRYEVGFLLSRVGVLFRVCARCLRMEYSDDEKLTGCEGMVGVVLY